MEQSEKLKKIADRLLDRLAESVDSGELDYATIKQICATMKDLKDVTGAAQKDTGVTVVLGKELEGLSK